MLCLSWFRFTMVSEKKRREPGPPGRQSLRENIVILVVPFLDFLSLTCHFICVFL